MRTSDNETANTLFLRLEGPLQAWGDASKFVIRRCMDAPTKSGVLGLICCAMGLPRQAAREKLRELNNLLMGVRIDQPGTRWWDYHTVGARIGNLNAKGEVKKTAGTGEYETLITRREYLADASFLVALQGDAVLIAEVATALAAPKWPIFLGRKSCPPSMPVLVTLDDGSFEPLLKDRAGLEAALTSLPWRPRYEYDAPRGTSIDLPCLVEWRKSSETDAAPVDAEVWYDAPFSFDPPVHHARLVMRGQVAVGVGAALQRRTPPPPRPRADYKNKEYQAAQEAAGSRRRALRLLQVAGHHGATRHLPPGRRGRSAEDLRSLCRLCHDAVTMIEYGLGMGLDRINPCDPRWRDDILRTRGQIVRFRSEETRRRALREAPEKVRREVLEEDD